MTRIVVSFLGAIRRPCSLAHGICSGGAFSISVFSCFVFAVWLLGFCGFHDFLFPRRLSFWVFLFSWHLWFLGSILRLLCRQGVKHQFRKNTMSMIILMFHEKGKIQYCNWIYRNTLIPSNGTIYTQHACASTFILYVHKAHVVHCKHPECVPFDLQHYIWE